MGQHCYELENPKKLTVQHCSCSWMKTPETNLHLIPNMKWVAMLFMDLLLEQASDIRPKREREGTIIQNTKFVNE